jgi:anti-anti-sigma factor
MQQVKLSSKVTAAAVIIRLAGEIDHVSAEDAAARLARAVAPLPPPGAVILDLTNVSLLSAAGLRTVHGCAVACAERGLLARLVVAPGSVVHRVVGLLPLDPRVSTFDSAAQALHALDALDRPPSASW